MELLVPSEYRVLNVTLDDQHRRGRFSRGGTRRDADPDSASGVVWVLIGEFSQE